jgi:hypothetical protein
MSRRIVRKDKTMISKSRSLLLAATLMAIPMAAAVAQQSTTSGTQPMAAPNSPNMNFSTAAKDPDLPGATGNTVVQGSGSSMSGSNRVVPNANAAATTAGGGDGGK